MNEYNCIDKWRLNELNEIVDSVDEDIYNEILENKIQYAIDYINIILRVMGSSIICMREIICLSSCGYPDGCMALARLLCEHAVILYFLDSSKNAPDFSQIIENYYNDSEVKRTKTLLFTAEKAKNEDKINELKDKLENFTSAIPTYNRKNKSDYWWTNINSFADMFNEVIKRNQEIDGKNDFLLSLYIDYKLACLQTHSSCLGNAWRIGKPNDITTIDTSPTAEVYNIPLLMALKSFFIVLLVAYENLSLDFNKYKHKLNELLAFYKDQNIS